MSPSNTKEYARLWRLKNKEHIAKTKKAWGERNKEKKREYSRRGSRKWREKHPIEYREQIRQRNEKIKQLRKLGIKYISMWGRNNPHKKRVEHFVQWMIKKGEIQRPSCCQECSATTKIDAHHDNYLKPLDIMWLCRTCHSKRHQKLKQIIVKEEEVPHD